MKPASHVFVNRSSFVNFANILYRLRQWSLSIGGEKFLKESIQTHPELTVKKASVSRQTISWAEINKDRQSFTSAQVFGLPCSTGRFRFPSKICDRTKKLCSVDQ